MVSYSKVKRMGQAWSVLLNASYHKKHECIWIRDGDLKGFQRYQAFYEVNR